MAVDVKLIGFDRVLKDLARVKNEAPKSLERIHYRISTRWRDFAVRYAPKSPTDKERKKQSRATAAQWKAARKRRSKTSTSRRKPGGLMHSITARSNEKFAEVFVPVNSEAGGYAFKMHEEKGQTWFKRGAGTIAKGAKADAKYITRAGEDEAPRFIEIINDELERLKKD